MKIIIIFIDLLMATVLFFVGRFFIKSRNTERSVLFLSRRLYWIKHRENMQSYWKTD